MSEKNKITAAAFMWIWPEFSMTIPGDFILGVILALQAGPSENFTPLGTTLASMTGLLFATSLFCLYKSYTAHSILSPYVIGTYRLIATIFCSSLAFKNGIPPHAVLAGIILGTYSASISRIGQERFRQTIRKLGIFAWWPTILAGIVGISCVVRNFAFYGATAPAWMSGYMGVWLLFRTFYISNAVKGWCTPSRLFQADGLLVRGMIPLQAAVFMLFATSQPWNAIAAAILAMILSTFQTIACKLLPTPEF
ncbi:MAG TPA: hypothetical protein PKK48_08880 [Phycisphaerae bacterium]|nr:hypothetical protein [Phycisphaerae bacterium]